MTAQAMEEDLACVGNETNGQRLYKSCGISGIRGEAAKGFPSVRYIGLPVFRSALEKGRNMARITALLYLIAGVEDTNMIARGGRKGAMEGAKMTAILLRREFDPEDVFRLDQWFIRRNLSPGGCADLLAAVCFVYELTKKDGAK